MQGTNLQACTCRVWEDIMTGIELIGINLTERISIKKATFLMI